MSITELLLRLVLSFIVLLLLTRFMGRKEISQLTFFNFVSAISLGTLGASLAIDNSISITKGLIALIAWSIFTIVMGLLDIKSRKARLLIEGSPRIVVRKGKVLEGELRKLRLDIGALNVMLRKKNIFSLKDVDYAIFETDGTLSVMKKEAKQQLMKEDLNITPKTNTFEVPTMIISDGQLSQENLEQLNLSKSWLEAELIKQGIKSMNEVFYAEVQKDGSLYIDKYGDRFLN
ncbi:YetF domain-containing protein [Fictibacillus sp. BK138]|uniref:YetF domain-containing protein n=1 Tax=Fictibacillus sp. BK138 TaxID=2512121 RepID=UPI0010292AAC|nr:DUF421 domain-containing protein [Fictibacillus sp. BK138]RZT23641.1 uncharacterized membrane protein YcaP (DUF421 family) [Fictibacillus sp. BK138]